MDNLKTWTKYSYKIYVTNSGGATTTAEWSFNTQTSESTINDDNNNNDDGDNDIIGDLGDLFGWNTPTESTISSPKILSHKTYWVSTNRILINFETNEKTQAYVLFGEGSNLNFSTRKEESFTYSNHTQVMDNLKTWTKYNYKIYITNSGGATTTTEWSFTTQASESTIDDDNNNNDDDDNDIIDDLDDLFG